MKKVNIYLIMAAAIGIAAASVGSSHTAIYAEHQSVAQMLEGPDLKNDKELKHHHGGMSKEQFEAYRLKRLQEMAVYFGISTEGKSADQLKKELLVAKEANKEKWEAFKAEHRAKRLEHLQKIAEKHGIETKGKTEDQLREELEKAHGDKEKHHWKERSEQREEPTPQPTAAPEKEVKPQPTAAPEKEAKPQPKAAPEKEAPKGKKS
ncbi:hypothetical protein D3P09_14300 [Paenibacillus pinisoli]|uniref:DUF2680 domain-containing protein n=1 Tax=Paenibacillus pinisoli TaxID=1276110 RepID=A0A3A6PEX4_9BACL|nr:hypothetical protein [Paenibacillus pinisoli]RJX38710.1 hypothetical protein D3P09_14300 [Paenibacillus pinisoli]